MAGYSMYDVNIKEIENEVRECDRAIIRWYLEHGRITPNDYIRIHRPSLVKVRLDVMRKFNMAEFDEDGNAHLKGWINVDILPINSDQLKFRSKMILVVYKLIADYNPSSVVEIVELLSQIYNRSFGLGQVSMWVNRLKKLGLVKKQKNRYVVTYSLLTDDYETLYREWERETKSIREQGRKMALIIREARKKKREENQSH